MKTATLFLGLATLALVPTARAAEPDARLTQITREIRELVGEVRALIPPKGAKADPQPICFRVGRIYQTLRHELDEHLREATRLARGARALGEKLVLDGKSLPSFCGDHDQVKRDPGYEQVHTLPELQRELTNVDARAERLLGMLNE